MGSPDGKYPTGEPRPALITYVYDPDNPESAVDLTVFTRTGMFCNPRTPYGPDQPGCWSWPKPPALQALEFLHP